MSGIAPLINRRVVSVGPSQTLSELARIMIENRVGAAVVMTEDGAPGIVTERDMLRAASDGVDLTSTTVDRYMTDRAITASETWEVEDAARRMIEGHFRHLVVMDEGGRVAGILSVRDLMPALLGDPPE